MSDTGATQPSRAGNAPASDRDDLKLASGSSLVEPRLYIRDHTYKQYVIPYKLGKEWHQFKNFLEEVYIRRGGGEHLENIRNDKVDVKVSTSRGYDVVLPSLWDEVIAPEAHIRIAFWSDDNANTRARPKDNPEERERDVEFAQVEVDVSEDEWAYNAPMQRERIGVRPPPPPPRPGRRTRPSSDGASQYSSEDEWFEKSSSWRRDSEADNMRPRPPPPPRPGRRPRVSFDRTSKEEESTTEDEDEEEELTDKEDEEQNQLPPAPEHVRIARTPTDEDGNALCFSVDTSWKVYPEDSGDSSKESRDGPAMNANTLNITKALAVTSDGKTGVQVHTLPGPEKSTLNSSVGIRWYHVRGELLDWKQFKYTCLNLPTLSDGIRRVIRKTFKKIENDNIKPFQGGMFIEPGTVLRGDDINKSGPSSVIFSCIPYFDIRKPLNLTTSHSDHLHPARTLMQSYYPKYPYEPMQERDDEQAFRKFGNARHNSLVHVPSLWMLNINSDIVVTAGYRPLSSEFVKSIEVVEEDLKNQLSASNKGINPTCVRLADLCGRTLLFKLEETRTYFELEQIVRELRILPGNRCKAGSLIVWKGGDGFNNKIGPQDWPRILRRSKSLFIDLAMISREKTEGKTYDRPEELQGLDETRFPEGSVPPFLEWGGVVEDGSPAGKGRSLRILEALEKKMKSESVPVHETTGPIDETFTTSKYYDSLRTETLEKVQRSPPIALNTQPSRAASPSSTFHQFVVETNHIGLQDKGRAFVRVVKETLQLFVSDVDSATILCKVWGSMANLFACIESLSNTRACEPDPKEFSERAWKGPITGKRSWRIRLPSSRRSEPEVTKVQSPTSDSDELVASIKRCRRCRRKAPFNDPNDALEHLRAHLKKVSSDPNEAQALKSTPVPGTESLKDWIYNDDQAIVELTLAKAELILEEAISAARSILDQLKELVDGVRKEDGYMLGIYLLPRSLVEGFHRLIVFYMAVERSLHFAVKDFQAPKRGRRFEGLPDTVVGLDVLERFVDGVRRHLLKARIDLCLMGSSSNPHDYWKRTSLGPQYICAWLMRRLIVQPLDNSKTIADMYRDYLSTLQFQVNHRPGKRLLRSINLLKEELDALSKVNEWQTRLVGRYLSVLDDETYPIDIPSRRALFPHERLVLDSCIERLAFIRADYTEQIERCGPLSESTKQSAEINEEDHGKAILVFTVVTIIFLPLSFVTSYLGMNTVDVRDMENTQALFWEISIPLTAVVLGVITFIAYNGDEVRDRLDACYRTLVGKKSRSASSMTRKQGAKRQLDSSSTLEYKSLADDAEYASPEIGNWNETRHGTYPPIQTTHVMDYEPPQARSGGRTPALYATQRFAAMKDEWALEDELANFILEEERLISAGSPTMARLHRSKYVPRQRSHISPYTKTSNIHAYPGYKPTASTYTRVKRDLVLPESIENYGFAWEFDPQDKDAILIKENLSEREVDQLYAHTRRLKEIGTEKEEDEWHTSENRNKYGAGGRGRTHDYYGGGGRRDEYTWVKKGGKGRRREGVDIIRPHEPYDVSTRHDVYR